MTLTISQQGFAEELKKRFCVDSVQSVPITLGGKLEDFNEDDETETWSFRQLLDSLMWLSTLIRPDILNAV